MTAGASSGSRYDLPRFRSTPAFDASLVRRFPVHPLAKAGVERNLGRSYRLPDDAPAVILTDDYNPADLYDVALKEWVREMIWKHIDRDLLL